jgi:probable rRNA maturation factor
MIDAPLIEVSVEAPGWDDVLGGDAESFARTVLARAAAMEGVDKAVAVALTGDGEVRALNKLWRGQDKPTNVLSFPAPDIFPSLGDIALALETVTREAEEQNKPAQAHTAHLLVHGLLHLIGYDHEADADAERMEAREREILAALGYGDPYAEANTSGTAAYG